MIKNGLQNGKTKSLRGGKKEKRNMRFNLSCGTYRNGLTAAHVKFLKKINENSSKNVYLFLDSKERVEEIKEGEFCLSDSDRKTLLSGLSSIENVTIFNSDHELCEQIQQLYDTLSAYNDGHELEFVFHKGGDYSSTDEISIKEFINNLSSVSRVVLAPKMSGMSTTQWIQELQGKK